MATTVDRPLTPSDPPQKQSRASSAAWGSRANRLFWQIVMVGVALVMVAPVLWMISTSLKPENETVSAIPRWIPEHATLKNYADLFTPERSQEFPILRWFANSVGISLTVTVLVLVVTSMAAYAFGRLHFKGRDALFLLVIGTMAIPGQVSLIPVFLIVKNLGLFNTYAGIVLPGLASAFGVFLLRQFFVGIPTELEEAAFLDGANHFTTFWRVILPLGKPALATLAIFTFMGSWNDFVWPLLVTSDLKMRTLPVGLSIFQGRYTLEYGLTMAAAAVTTLPMIVAFLLFQKRITEGIAMTGMK